MRTIFAWAFLLVIVSCRKELTETDYDQLIGEYKLVYTLKETSSTIERLNPSDNFQIDVTKKWKVHKYKNGHCESKEKVENCQVYSSATSIVRYVNLFLKDRAGSVEMYLPLSPGEHDTLIINGFYPYENDPNGTPYHYAHYYVKE
jgi:hypothetical protein